MTTSTILIWRRIRSDLIATSQKRRSPNFVTRRLLAGPCTQCSGTICSVSPEHRRQAHVLTSDYLRSDKQHQPRLSRQVGRTSRTTPLQELASMPLCCTSPTALLLIPGSPHLVEGCPSVKQGTGQLQHSDVSDPPLATRCSPMQRGFPCHHVCRESSLHRPQYRWPSECRAHGRCATGTLVIAACRHRHSPMPRWLSFSLSSREA